MQQEPLTILRRARRDGLIEFLDCARKEGVRLAVFSDYPALRKLAALEITDFFEVVTSAHDHAIGRFKPDPLGIEVTIDRLGVERARTLYIGDRPDTDATAAERAGVACIILGRRGQADSLPWIGLPGFRTVRDVVFPS